MESFHLFLTSNFPLVTPHPDTAEVLIHDDSESELTLIPPGLYLFVHENKSIMHVVNYSGNGTLCSLDSFFVTFCLVFSNFIVLSHYVTQFPMQGLVSDWSKGHLL